MNSSYSSFSLNGDLTMRAGAVQTVRQISQSRIEGIIVGGVGKYFVVIVLASACFYLTSTTGQNLNAYATAVFSSERSN